SGLGRVAPLSNWLSAAGDRPTLVANWFCLSPISSRLTRSRIGSNVHASIVPPLQRREGYRASHNRILAAGSSRRETPRSEVNTENHVLKLSQKFTDGPLRSSIDDA